MTYLVGEAELLCGTDPARRKRRGDRRSCQRTLHCVWMWIKEGKTETRVAGPRPGITVGLGAAGEEAAEDGGERGKFQ